jgi:glutaredoxin
MKAKLVLYSRADCSLCEEMKDAIREVAAKVPLELEEIDVDSSMELKKQFGDQIPVLFIDGRRAFKHKVTAKALRKRLGRRPLWARWRGVKKEA